MNHGGDALPLPGVVPAILVLGDSAAARATGAGVVQAIGGRLVAALAITEALPRLENPEGIDGLHIELEEDGGDMLDALLAQVEQLAQHGLCAGVIALPEALIDMVTARITHPDVQLLCAPDDVERSGALALAVARRRARVGDAGIEGEARRLQQLSEEMSRIAKALVRISEEGLNGKNGVGERVMRFRADAAPIMLSADQVRGVIRARRMRDRFFSAELFADPAWDMLLDLTAARMERRDVAVSSLCIAAAVPPTTALRWIRTMTEAGLLVREADFNDGRRVFITLSAKATEGMNAYFAAVRQMGGAVI